MPKAVDHEARRRELAEAVWRVVLRDGVERASVRTVAAEAGWSTGSLRHYFPTQEALLSFAMELAAATFLERIAPLQDVTDPRTVLRALALELLPLDEQRRAEMAVWLSFVARSRVDPSLHEAQRKVNGETQTALRRILTWARNKGALRPGVDPVVEALRLHSLLDGLALHALLDPELFDPESIVATVDTHLAGLLADTGTEEHAEDRPERRGDHAGGEATR
ncbi:MAG TPA: TetR family transcriptional regulator C-terminal domain-containing protein [Pseudonocardiaceae bacterium]